MSRRQYTPEEEDLLHKIHDNMDAHPALEYLRAITPPRPPRRGERNAAEQQPSALETKCDPELFATAQPGASADLASTLAPSPVNNSPLPRVSASNGELIGAAQPADAPASASPATAQLAAEPAVAESAAAQPAPRRRLKQGRIIRHQPRTSGEKIAPPEMAPSDIAPAETTPAEITPSEMTADLLTSEPGDDDPPLPLAAVPPRAVRRGRPAALDETDKGRLLGLIAFGLSFRQAAAQLGVHHQTILNTMQRDPDFAQQVAEARHDAVSQPLATVIGAARKNWRAAAWLAKFLEDRRSRTLTWENTPEEREIERCKRS